MATDRHRKQWAPLTATRFREARPTGGTRLNAILLTALLGTTPIRLDEVRALSRENIPQRISELNAALAHDQKTASISAVLPQINFSAGVARTYYSAAQTLIGPFKDPAFPDTDPHYRQDVVPQIAFTSDAYTSST